MPCSTTPSKFGIDISDDYFLLCELHPTNKIEYMRMKTNYIVLKRSLTVLLIMFTSIYSYAQYDSFPFGGYNRTFLMHLPIRYNGTSDIPLIVVMHGGFGNAYNIENQSQLSAKADAENFIVVSPEGVKGGAFNISSWNAGGCCGFASSSNVDDVGFIDALLDTLLSQYAIDSNRIYATGMSNGGFMSYRLACELSDRIAAIAPVAASMSMVACNPVRPVPVIAFHSYLDTNVPYLGGVGSGPSGHNNSPQDSVLNVWAGMNNCMNLNDTIIDNNEYTLIKWTSGDCASEVHHYATQDGGHSWPGGVQTVIGDPVSSFINATDLMWSFFQQHTLNCSPLSAFNKGLEKNKTEIYPNPTNGQLKIHSEIIYTKLEISVYSLTGQKILTVKDQTEIDISHLTKGAYFIKVKMDGAIRMEKIIKIE